MDDTSNTHISAANRIFFDFEEDAAAEDEEEEEDDDDEFCDVETWETLSKSFREVQSVLDRNRRLIQQVNDNHRSRMPHNLAKNVDLICEINANMSKVVSLYSNLTANLSTVVHRRRDRNQIVKIDLIDELRELLLATLLNRARVRELRKKEGDKIV